MQFVDKSTTASKITGNWCDKLQAHKIALLSQAAGQINAVLGGILATRAKVIGVTGIVVDGNIRDINEQRSLGLPIFSKGYSTIGADFASRAE